MKLFLISVFGLLFFQLSAQHVSDTKQIFHKIDSQMIQNPLKARELISFTKKNFQNKEIINHCDRLLVQTYYYENNYNDALQQILLTADQQNVEGVISYRNILYAAGIQEVGFTKKYNKALLFQLNEEILKANELVFQNSQQKAFEKIINFLPKITNSNKDTFRDSFIFLLSNLGENDWLTKHSNYHNPVLKILSYYPDDLAFDILNKRLFPANISENWLVKTNNLIENSTNFRLKIIYYNVLLNYYSDNKEVSNYTLISDKKEDQVGKKNRAITQARSQWIYLTEKKYDDEFIYANKRGFFIVISIILLFCIITIILVIKIRQEKIKGKSYQLLSNKLKTNSNKRKEPQVISENVKLVLLEKLEKLELTNFYLDSNISIQTLAKKLDSNSKYVSDTINTYKKKSFTAYINELRIEYIKQKLNNELIYRSYKIKYLAEESGFSSHSVFSSVFKSIEGISPAQYIQLLK